jgi:hypothetical protein
MVIIRNPVVVLSYTRFMPKPSTHSMCAQVSSLHTYCIEIGYKITNVIMYNIYYRIMSLQKTKSTGNRLVAIARLEHHIEVLQVFFIFREADGQG